MCRAYPAWNVQRNEKLIYSYTDKVRSSISLFILGQESIDKVAVKNVSLFIGLGREHV